MTDTAPDHAPGETSYVVRFNRCGSTDPLSVARGCADDDPTLNWRYAVDSFSRDVTLLVFSGEEEAVGRFAAEMSERYAQYVEVEAPESRRRDDRSSPA